WTGCWPDCRRTTQNWWSGSRRIHDPSARPGSSNWQRVAKSGPQSSPHLCTDATAVTGRRLTKDLQLQTETRLHGCKAVGAVEGGDASQPRFDHGRIGLQPLGGRIVGLLAVVKNRAHDLVLHLQREDKLGQKLAEVWTLGGETLAGVGEDGC